MRSTTIRIISIILVIMMLASTMFACNKTDNAQDDGNKVIDTDKDGENSIEPTGPYNEGVVLVKSVDFTTALLGELKYENAEPLYTNSQWYIVTLKEGVKAKDAVSYLTALGTLDAVEYDYILTTSDVEPIDISGNAYDPNPASFEAMGIQKAWQSLEKDGIGAGGSSDVIIAVIDTGVDYNHVDLRNNIWVNTAEIPGNGIDDDGNGYIDDVYGWNFVGDNNEPYDDSGHGTHVAGIIAAENNDIGTVGIAYNCKIMVLKAATSSGTLNSSDIAEAVQYAYMNGASVISMSFSGTSISLAVEEALKNAYNQCVLVAAAGNNATCNEPNCPEHAYATPYYPAAYTFVVGVMSCNDAGTSASGFTNFDHYLYNQYEYDVYAPGESISSTFPNNKYAKLGGTSMSTPAVSAIAALVRSKYTDRNTYSSKFIAAQLVQGSGNYVCVNADDALNGSPAPRIYNAYNYYIYDGTEISDKNNGNGIIEAGETIYLGVEFMNRGGKASDVSVELNTKRLAEDVVDRYITIETGSVKYPDIGTYSIGDSSVVLDKNGNVTGISNPLVITFADDTPNDYVASLNLVIKYKNGLDSEDTESYEGKCTINVSVSNGYILPRVISEDTVYTNDRRYIVANDVIIPEGVTVTFEEGCEVQFYDAKTVNTPAFLVYGNLNFIGTEDAHINIHPSQLFENYVCKIYPNDNAKITFDYCELHNLCNDPSASSMVFFSATGSSVTMSNSSVYYDTTDLRYVDNNIDTTCVSNLIVNKATNCYFDLSLCSRLNTKVQYAKGNMFKLCYGNMCWFGDSYDNQVDYQDNVFMFIRSSNFNKYDTMKLNFSATVGDKATLVFKNNVFLAGDLIDADNVLLLPINLVYTNGIIEGNIYDTALLEDQYDSKGNLIFKNDPENHDDSKLWPYIKNIEYTDKNGNPITTVDGDTANVKVTFSKALTKSNEFKLYYGSTMPYADYIIDGEWNEDGTEWNGTIKVTASIENGKQFVSVGDAFEKDSTRKLVDNAYRFTFNIDTTKAMAMNLQTAIVPEGVKLTWAQDDYQTLMGYNVYRSEDKDGNYVKLNTSVIPAGENTFIDENAEPGKTYWYTFTVVLSDFSESKPAGRMSQTTNDTIKPSIYHTPVNQGYSNSNLIITCTASDNVGIKKVVVYYRNVGDNDWKSLEMAKLNDKYSAAIFGGDLSLAGLEYYIVATDGQNEVQKGSKNNPYKVVIKDASTISKCGDVDGDGQITTKDALLIIQSINGECILSDDEFKRADLDGNQKLSSKEALRILQYINGKVTTLEMPKD